MELTNIHPILLSFILIVGLLLIIVAIGGSFLPVLPGPPLAILPIIGLAVFNLFDFRGFHLFMLVLLCFLVILISILDYLLPVTMSKQYGAGKEGQWGSTLGILVAIFVSTPLGPFAIFVGPFIGALIGEIIAGKPFNEALKAAWGTMIGFLIGSFGKAILCIFILLYYIYLLFYVWP